MLQAPLKQPTPLRAEKVPGLRPRLNPMVTGKPPCDSMNLHRARAQRAQADRQRIVQEANAQREVQKCPLLLFVYAARRIESGLGGAESKTLTRQVGGTCRRGSSAGHVRGQRRRGSATSATRIWQSARRRNAFGDWPKRRLRRRARRRKSQRRKSASADRYFPLSLLGMV